MKGYGFNWEILTSNLIYINKISLQVDHGDLYVFPKSVLKEYGYFINYVDQGFELQRFMKFDLIKIYKVTNNDPKLSFTEVTR